MKYHGKRITATLVAVLMLLTSMPAAFAEGAISLMNFGEVRSAVIQKASITVSGATLSAEGLEKTEHTITISVNSLIGEKISLVSPRVTVSQAGVSAEGLYQWPNESTPGRVVDSASCTPAAYFMLESKQPQSSEYELNVYGAQGNKLDVSKLVIVTNAQDAVQVTLSLHELQKTVVTSQDKQQQIDYQDDGSPRIVTIYGNEGQVFDLASLAGPAEYIFLTGEKKNAIPVEKVQLVKDGDEYNLKPVLISQQEENGQLCMVVDTQYAFQFSAQKVTQEHGEDNNDVYLWKGTKYRHGSNSNEYGGWKPAALKDTVVEAVTNTVETVQLSITGRLNESFTVKDIKDDQDSSVDFSLIYASKKNFTEPDYNESPDSKKWYEVGRRDQRGTYWICETLQLNSGTDNIMYLQIVEKDGGVVLQAVKGSGETFAIGTERLYTPKMPLVQPTKQGIVHVNVRVSGSIVKTGEDGKNYSGMLDIQGATAKVYYSGASFAVYSDNTWSRNLKKTSTAGNNGNSSSEFGDASVDKFSAIPRADALNPDKVSVTIEIRLKDDATLTSTDGTELQLDSSYRYTLTKAQMAAAIAACPNQWGYDIIVDLAELINDAEKTTSVLLTKVWKDNGNALGKRPSEVTLTLGRKTGNSTDLAGFTGNEFVLDSTDAGASNANVWTRTVNDLAYEDEKGNRYTYGVMKESFDNKEEAYTSQIDGTTVTNTLAGGAQTAVTVTKIWLDGEGERRPDKLRVYLYQQLEGANPTLYQYYDMTQENSEEGNTNIWKYTFAELPTANQAGKEYSYAVDENPVDGYKKGKSGNVLTNTFLTDISVEKIWNNDAENEYKTRPNSITVELLAGQESTGMSVVLDSNNKWTASFKDVPKYDAEGQAIAYTVKEQGVPVGYTSVVQDMGNGGFTITNTLQLGDMTIEKNVIDTTTDATASGKQTFTFTVTEQGKDEPVARFTLTDSDTSKDMAGQNDSYKVENLVIGKTYVITETANAAYTTNAASETLSLSGKDNSYTLKLTKSGANVTFTNTRKGAPLTIVKQWMDGKQEYTGHGAGYIEVRLTANPVVELGDGGNIIMLRNGQGQQGSKWTYTYENVTFPTHTAGGQAVTYGGQERRANDGTNNPWVANGDTFTLAKNDKPNEKKTFAVSVTTATPAQSQNTVTITNNKQAGLGQLTVKKTVQATGADAEKQFTFQVLDAENKAITVGGKDTFMLGHGQEQTFTGLDDGRYTIVEQLGNDATNWATSVTGATPSSAREGNVAVTATLEEGGREKTVTFTNTRKGAGSVTVEKKWMKGGENYDGHGVTSLDVRLIASVGGVEDSGILANAQKSITLTKAGGWTKTIGGLPLYSQDGKPVTYTAQESYGSGDWVGDGSTLSIADNSDHGNGKQKTYAVSVTSAPDESGNTAITITNTLQTAQVTLQKVIEDDTLDKEAGLSQPFTFTVEDSQGTQVGGSITLGGSAATAGEIAAGWKTVALETPLQLNVGETYTITEAVDAGAWQTAAAVTGGTNAVTDGAAITFTVSAQGNQIIFTNTRKGEGYTITKTWLDGGEKRPENAPIVLEQLREDVPVQDFTAPEPTVDKGEGNVWTYTWDKLPQADPATGVQYAYRAYEGGVDADGVLEIADNRYLSTADQGGITNILLTNLVFRKSWADDFSNKGERPDLTFQLYAGGDTVDARCEADTRPPYTSADRYDYYRYTDVPKYDNANQAIDYRVYELAEDAAVTQDTNGVIIGGRQYNVTYSSFAMGNDKGQNAIYTISNWQHQTVEGTKKWAGVGEMTEEMASILKAQLRLKLQISQDGGKTWQDELDSTRKGVINGLPYFEWTNTLGDTWEFAFHHVKSATNEGKGTPYMYRVVELDASGNPVAEGGVVTLSGVEYVVGYDGATVTNSHEPELSINKQLVQIDGEQGEYTDGTPVRTGNRLTYRVTVKNTSPVRANNVKVKETLPANAIFISATPGNPENGGYDAQSNVWTITALEGGASEQLVVEVDVTEQQSDATVSNLVEVIGEGGRTLNPDSAPNLRDDTTNPLANLTFTVGVTWDMKGNTQAGKVADDSYFVGSGSIAPNVRIYGKGQLLKADTHYTVSLNGTQAIYTLIDPQYELADIRVAQAHERTMDGNTQGADVVHNSRLYLSNTGGGTLRAVWPFQGTYSPSNGMLDDSNHVQISNELMDIPIKKIWNDANGQAFRPESIEVTLISQALNTQWSVTLQADDWTGRVYLPVANNSSGQDSEIVYTLRENGKALDEKIQLAEGGAYYRATGSGDALAGYTLTNRRYSLKVEKDVTLVNGVAALADYKAKANDLITYQVKVTNDGSVDLTGIVLTDSLAGISAITGENGVNPQDFDLATGAWATFTYTYLVTEADIVRGEGIPNVATATSDDGTTDEDEEKVEISDIVTVTLTKEIVDQTLDSDAGRGEAFEFAIEPATEDGTNQVTLGHEGLATLTLKAGTAYTITEKVDGAVWSTESKSTGVQAPGAGGAAITITAGGGNDGQVTFTNTRKAYRDEGAYQAMKVWQGIGESSLPESADIMLKQYAGGTETGQSLPAVDVSKDAFDPQTGTATWRYGWYHLPAATVDGQAYTYQAVEGDGSGYVVIDGMTFQVAYNAEGIDGIPVITNTYVPPAPSTMTVEGSKTWVDQGNALNTRPGSITVTVTGQQSGQTYSTTVSGEGDTWSWSIPNLPIDTYTVSEAAVPSYQSQVSGTTITNTLSGGETTVSGVKAWNDVNADVRPASVTVALYADGVDTGLRATAAANSGWAWSFSGLAKYLDGREIAYTVQEMDVPDGYEAAVNGTTITNTAREYTLTIRYWYNAVGADTAAATYTRSYRYGEAYNVASPQIGGGWTPDSNRVRGTMPAQDVEFDVVYTRDTYTLTINYVYSTGGTAAPTYRQTGMYAGDDYDVTSPRIDGYTVSRERVNGTMPARSLEFTVIYTPQGTGDDVVEIINEYGVPLGIGSVVMNLGDCFE